MGFSKENGYTPVPIDQMMVIVMGLINEQFGTAYTIETFVGTNEYKYFYALMQRLQENEVKTSEIFLKVQSYFRITNETLARPNTTVQGLIDYCATMDFDISVKPPIEAEAGELRVAVNLDDAALDFADKKIEFANILKTCVPAGVVTIGDETETVILSNAQSFDFNFNLATTIPILLKVTLVQSDNNLFTVLNPEEIAALLFENVNARYHFGLNFEPQRYFSVVDAPWAESVLLQYSVDAGGNWLSAVATLAYDDLYTFGLADITVVES
jgi:hypothetical protein